MTTPRYQVRMSYAYPERLMCIQDEHGRDCLARIPGHPVRYARPTDASTWWQDISLADAVVAEMDGAEIRQR